MSCIINEEQRRALRKAVYSNLLEESKSKEPFDINSYISKMYNDVKTATENEPLALDVARLIPLLAGQVIQNDSELKDSMRVKGLTVGKLDDLEVKFNDLEAVREM